MSFLEKNLLGITEIIQNSLFAEEIAKKPGYLQRLDPRTKLICFIMLLLAISLSQNIALIISIYFLLLILAYSSKISLKFFITRVWLFLPFFTGIIALPATLNVFTPGKSIVILLDISRPHIFLALTENGIMIALYLITRVATSVSLAILLVLTTDWIKLLKALEKLHFPPVLIMVSLMTYRYIFVLLQTANNMFLARKSRSVGKPLGKTNRMWISSAVGVLFGKTYTLSEEVYSAMKSRGYNNKIHILGNFRYTFVDYASIASTILIIMSLYIIWR